MVVFFFLNPSFIPFLLNLPVSFNPIYALDTTCFLFFSPLSPSCF